MFWLNWVGLGSGGRWDFDLWLLGSNGLMGVIVVLWGLGVWLDFSVIIWSWGLVMLCCCFISLVIGV